MALAEVPPFHNPFENLGHVIHEVPAWAGRHWKPLALTVAALGGTADAAIYLARPLNAGTQIAKPVPVSDTFNHPEPKPGFIIEEFSTATPEPSKTATPIVEVTASPTTAPTIAPTRVVEKPTSLNAENLDSFVVPVSPAIFQDQAEKHPNKMAFPAYSENSDFEVKYEEKAPTSESTQGNVKRLFISGSDIELRAPTNGEIHFRRNDRSAPDKITAISIFQKLPDGTTLSVGILISSDYPNTQINSVIDDGVVKKGTMLARINGKVLLSITVDKQLETPLVTKRSDGTIVEVYGFSTYIVPPLFPTMDAANDWIRDLATGKIAISNGS